MGTVDVNRAFPSVIPAQAGIHNHRCCNGQTGFVYILASARHGTLYVGVTSDLVGRLHEHREGLIEGFTRDYGVKRLVHFEMFDDIVQAITREKQMKKWRRDWKIRLIEDGNPDWTDLAIGMDFAPLLG